MTNETVAPLSTNDDVIDLRELFGTLLAGWPWLVAAVISAFLGGMAYLFLAPPQYTSDALVQVEPNQNSARVAFAQLAEVFESESPVGSEIEIIKSRMVLQRVVERLGLDIDVTPQRFPLLGSAFARRNAEKGSSEPPAWLKPLTGAHHAWGAEFLRVTTLHVPANHLELPFTLRVIDGERVEVESPTGQTLGIAEAGTLFKAELPGGTFALFIQQIGARSGQTFFATKRRPELVADEIRKRLRVSNNSRAAPTIISLTFWDHSPELSQRILSEILTVYLTQNVERRSAEAAQTLDFLNKQLPDLRRQMEEAEARVNQFKVREGTADLGVETALLLQRSVEIEKKRAELEQQRTEALQRFTANHPVVQSIDSQIAQLDSQAREMSGRIRQLPSREQQALQLTRDVEVNTALYVALLNRTQELEVVKSGTIGSIRIIDTPVLPVIPSAPRKALILALAVVLGGMLGIIGVFILNALRNGVEDPSEVEKKLGLATYGAIPYSEEQGEIARLIKRGAKLPDGILAQRDPQGLAAEALRSVRTALHFAQMDAPNNIVMLTGPEPDLGKSFVSVNLGAVLAQAGRNVVVVDADLRRGHIHKMVGQERSPGLSDLITGAATVKDALRSTGLAGLSLIPTGTVPPNPSELLVNERLVELLQGLSERFDHVIVDTPPVLAVTDAAIIGRHAGITLLVLKAGQHPLRLIEETANRLTRAGVQVRGTLFNQIGRTRQGRYGYKYGYYYSGYQYAYQTKAAKA